MRIPQVQTLVKLVMSNKQTFSKVIRTGLGVGGAGLLLTVGLGVAIKESKEKYEEAVVSEDRLATRIGEVEIRTIPEKKIEEARIYGKKDNSYGCIKLQGGADIKFSVNQTEKKDGLLGYGSTHYISIGDTFISAQAVDNISINTHKDSVNVSVSDCSNAEVDVSEGNSPNRVSLRTFDKQISNVKVHLGQNDKVTFPFAGDSYFDQEYSEPGTYLLKHSNSNNFSTIAKIGNGTVQDIELPPEKVSFGGVNYDWKTVKKDENGNLMMHEEKNESTGEVIYNVTLENGVVVKYPKQAGEKEAHIDSSHESIDGTGSYTIINKIKGLQLWGSQSLDEITLNGCHNSDIHMDNDKPVKTDVFTYGDRVDIENSNNTRVHMNEYDQVHNYKDGEEVEYFSNNNKVKTKLYK